MLKYLLFLLFPLTLLSQNVIPNCQPEKSGWSETQEYGIPWGFNSDLFRVDYYTRPSKTGLEIALDWSVFKNDSKQITDSAAKEIVELHLIYQIAAKNAGFCDGTNEYFDVALVYTSNCTMQTKCLATIDENQKVECSDDPTITPEYYEKDGVTYHVILQRQPCCTSCCQKVYRFKCDKSGPVLSKIFKQKYPGTDCSGSSNFNFNDCITGAPVPCLDGCN